MAIEQWGQRAEIFNRQPRRPGRLPEDPLEHQGINVDQRILEEMQGEDRQFLVFPPIRGDIPAFAKEDEIIGAIPIFHDIEAFVNLAAEFAEPEIAAEKDGPARFAQFQKGSVGGVLDIVPRKATQNRVGLSGAEP
jgi:hypothetical protein